MQTWLVFLQMEADPRLKEHLHLIYHDIFEVLWFATVLSLWLLEAKSSLLRQKIQFVNVCVLYMLKDKNSFVRYHLASSNIVTVTFHLVWEFKLMSPFHIFVLAGTPITSGGLTVCLNRREPWIEKLDDEIILTGFALIFLSLCKHAVTYIF